MRLQTLASMSEVEIPFEALQDQINSAVDVHRPAHPARRRLPPDHRDRHPRLARPRARTGSPPSAASTPSPWAPDRASTAGSSTSRCRAGSPSASTWRASRSRQAFGVAAVATTNSPPGGSHVRTDPGMEPPLVASLDPRRHPAVRCVLAIAGVARVRRGPRPARRPLSTGCRRRPACPPTGRPAPLRGRRPAAAQHRARPAARAAAGGDGPGPHPGRVLRLHARRASPGCG